ncbi:unnamed protein product [Brassica oleracea var. botrytis]
MDSATQTRPRRIFCSNTRFRRWRLHTLSLSIRKPFVDCGLVDQHGFSRNKIRVIDDNIPPLS